MDENRNNINAKHTEPSIQQVLNFSESDFMLNSKYLTLTLIIAAKIDNWLVIDLSISKGYLVFYMVVD